MATWHTIDSARAEWDDAPETDETLQGLLDLAQEAVLAYAPGVDPDAVPTTIKPGWRVAQLRHARNVWASEYPGGDALSDLDGAASFGAPSRFRDLDASIRELIRPRRVFGGPIG